MNEGGVSIFSPFCNKKLVVIASFERNVSLFNPENLVKFGPVISEIIGLSRRFLKKKEKKQQRNA